ncbi:MAG: methyltransferase domain-containing protein [Caldilineaceae bacterium]|nr:methyltransferase domain-containing protein [Caldilineaceae bacterium]
MSSMGEEELRAQWLAEEEVGFVGWDFSYVADRVIEEEPPWDYMALAATRMAQASALLDMDTGGGEKLLSLRPHWPAKVVVTEGYPPNVALAQERLSLLGVTVVEADSSNSASMPFADDEFDLVLNRHGAFNANEVARILAPSGIFLTQQVHGLWAHSLLAHFGASPQWPDATYEDAITRLAAAGLELLQGADWRGKVIFQDVGALVYYLKAIPWLVPGFSVARDFDRLLLLQEKLEQEGELAYENMRYWVEARQPN